jgi:beta-lactamase regulating signal transducer with metallopeptidase domain
MFSWLLPHTLTTLLLAALALLAGRCLRLGPAGRHALWLVVLLKLLAPPIFYWPWHVPLAGSFTQPPAAEAQGELAVSSESPSGQPPHFDVAMTHDAGAEAGWGTPTDTEATGVMPQTNSAGLSPWLPTVAVAIWVGGGLLVLAFDVWRIGHLRRLVRRSAPAPGRLRALVNQASKALGGGAPLVGVLAGLPSPQVWALGPARLLWPRGLEEELPPDGCRAVLVHELAHVRRRDHWVGWLLLAAGCVWWWHPLLWLVRARLRREAELACDARVVATLPDARRAYAEALLAVCERGVVTPSVVAVGASGRRSDLERRLIMVMRDKAPGRASFAVLLAAGVLALAALPAWTLGQPDTTATVAVQTAAQPANAADDDRERRIQELEDRVQALLQELRALRGQHRVPAGGAAAPAHALTAPRVTVVGQPILPPKDVTAAQPLQPVTALVRVRRLQVGTAANVAGGDAEPVSEVTLSRATYRLPQDKAEALVKFLQETIKPSVLEAKVDKDTVVVTTTPGAQHVVAQLIALMQGKVPAGAVLHGYALPTNQPRDPAQ